MEEVVDRFYAGYGEAYPLMSFIVGAKVLEEEEEWRESGLTAEMFMEL